MHLSLFLYLNARLSHELFRRLAHSLLSKINTFRSLSLFFFSLFARFCVLLSSVFCSLRLYSDLHFLAVVPMLPSDRR